MLKHLWADGLSASQIAYELGGGITRNAVIGKVHRLGLGSTMSADQRVRKSRGGPRARHVSNAPRLYRTTDGNVIADNDVPELADDQIPAGQRRTLMDLEAGQCRWPVGDPSSESFFFCGGAVVVGKHYCAGHARIAYQGGSNKTPSTPSEAATPTPVPVYTVQDGAGAVPRIADDAM